MSLSPAFLGASLACALGGAFAGTALGSSPVIASDLASHYSASESAKSAVNHDASTQTLPDHYPLVTPAGTVPVEMLSNRGLYAQARYRGLYDLSVETVTTVSYSRRPQHEPAYVAEDESAAAGRPATVPVPAGSDPGGKTSPTPLVLAQPASIGSRGSAKTIDVKATLAVN